jgi:hypothetical protein
MIGRLCRGPPVARVVLAQVGRRHVRGRPCERKWGGRRDCRQCGARGQKISSFGGRRAAPGCAWVSATRLWSHIRGASVHSRCMCLYTLTTSFQTPCQAHRQSTIRARTLRRQIPSVRIPCPRAAFPVPNNQALLWLDRKIPPAPITAHPRRSRGRWRLLSLLIPLSCTLLGAAPCRSRAMLAED